MFLTIETMTFKQVFRFSYLVLNPTSYGISDSVAATGRGRGGLKNPPRYHGRSHSGLYIAVDHLLPGTYRGHMPIFRLISLTLNEILRLENFEKMRFFPR